jgi:hypothetical protein
MWSRTKKTVSDERGKKYRKGRYVLGAALLLGVALCVCSCIRMIDPVAYTQAVLDVTYKNETEQYIELTGATEEDAKQVFESNLELTSKIYKNAKLPEELENNYNQLFKDIILRVRYTVGEATKNEDGNYVVDVSVEPMTLFDDTYETFREKSAEYAVNLSNSVMEGTPVPTEEEMQQAVYQLYYDILKAELDAGLKYGKPETVQVHVNKTEEGTYEIPAEDIRMLDSKLVSQEKLLKAGEEAEKEQETPDGNGGDAAGGEKAGEGEKTTGGEEKDGEGLPGES